jgi:hypothetical protein
MDQILGIRFDTGRILWKQSEVQTQLKLVLKNIPTLKLDRLEKFYEFQQRVFSHIVLPVETK